MARLKNAPHSLAQPMWPLLRIQRSMEWTVLSKEADLQALEAASGDRGFLVFKHSTRCTVSTQAMRLLERYQAPLHCPPCFLVHVVEDRMLSLDMAARWNVHHESPQLLWWVQGTVTQHTSHFDVRGETISAWLD